jgi:hypothetical protein
MNRPQEPRDVAYDDRFWPPNLMGGSAHCVSNDVPEDGQKILVPDGAGDYREHRVMPRPKGRLGF